jgi:FtsP/CotA-like multicopper oxidase with cupredoxin domain
MERNPVLALAHSIVDHARKALHMSTQSEHFPTETRGLPGAQSAETLGLGNGEQYDLRIAPVVKQIGDAAVRMLAYNGSVPGPTLRVKQGSELTVNVINDADLEATVHWHGLRLDNRYDGTHETQPPMPVGGSFAYRITFPDPGVYWYHPHIREDYGQEMGLYGNIVVAPADPDYWPRVHREIALTIDDVLIENGKIAQFSRSQTTHTAMGRFGNVLLVNGEPNLSLSARKGEVVRFYLTNTANTRVFNVALPGARMKLVGGDSGHYEREQFVESVIIAPSERVVVDVLFSDAGELRFEHRTPKRTYSLATITVTNELAQPSLATEFEQLRTNADLTVERERLAPFLNAEPNKSIGLVAEMDMGTPEATAGAAIIYFCPMHSDVTSEGPGRCPKCFMKLLAKAQTPAPTAYACPMHPEVESDHPDRCPKCGMKLVPAHLVPAAHGGGHHHAHMSEDANEHDHGNAHHHEHTSGEHAHDTDGIEWEDDMVEVNRMTTPANTRWKVIDRATGADGGAINWRFRVGDRVKIRIVNEMESDHPMHHPFHIHGAGRFLILARDGVVEPNLVWKDTVLVPTGQTVDILLEVTNPGRWMAHCHIAEHHESGMMFSFDVDP